MSASVSENLTNATSISEQAQTHIHRAQAPAYIDYRTYRNRLSPLSHLHRN